MLLSSSLLKTGGVFSVKEHCSIETATNGKKKQSADNFK